MAKEPKERKPDALNDALEGHYPEAFMFKEAGSKLVGKVKGFSKGHSEYGPHLVVIVVNEEDGETVSVHCLHTTLRNQMLEADPKPGDRIGIKYVGESVSAKKGKGQGKTYKDFRVRVDASSRSASEVMRGMAVRSGDDEDGDGLPF